MLAVQCLQDAGVKVNDRLLAFASANYNLIIFILAAFQIGATVMYVDVLARQDTLSRFFREYKPKFVLASNRTFLLRFILPRLNQIQQVINVDYIRRYAQQNKNSSFEPDVILNPKVPENQIALLTTTTGSTARPKIVIRTHNDLLSQLSLIRQNIHLPKKRPIVLTTSYMYVFANLIQGFTTVLPNLNLRRRRAVINRKLKKFRSVDVNMILTSPDFCLKVSNDYPNLEYLYFGGAILNILEARKISQNFHQAKIIYIYGCTECNLISKVTLEQYISCLSESGVSNLGTIVDGVRVNIGKNNEICVQSSARTDHYLNNSFSCEQDAFYDTSDRGYMRGKNLFYLGKANGILHTPLGIVYSSQVEQNLALRFGFSKCAILEHEQEFYLFLEKPSIVSPDAIEQYVKRQFKIKPIVKYIRRIPCDIKHHTKINYYKLRKGLK